MGILAGVFLDGFGRTAVGISFAEDWVHGAAFDLIVAGAGVLLCFGLRLGGEVRNVIALGLKLGDGLLELGDGSTDVRKLDDVRIRLGGELAQFHQGVGDLLIGGEIFRKSSENPAGQRDVPSFHGDAGMLGESFDDWQQRIGREGRCFVGLRVNDGRDLGHKLGDLELSAMV